MYWDHLTSYFQCTNEVIAQITDTQTQCSWTCRLFATQGYRWALSYSMPVPLPEPDLLWALSSGYMHSLPEISVSLSPRELTTPLPWVSPSLQPDIPSPLILLLSWRYKPMSSFNLKCFTCHHFPLWENIWRNQDNKQADLAELSEVLRAAVYGLFSLKP